MDNKTDKMKRKHSIILAAACGAAICAASACGRFDPAGHVFPNSIYLDVSATDQVQPANISNRAESASYSLAAVLAYPADSDIEATIAVDPALVESYNSRFGTDYSMLPSQYLDFSSATVTVEAGRTTSETVTILMKDLLGQGDDQQGALEIDRTWLLPVTVSSPDMPSMQGSATAFYLVKRTSAITVAAQLTDNWISFPLLDQPGDLADVYNDLTAVTYEALIYIDRFDTSNSFGECNISTVMGVEQYLLLRIGDANFERQQLQFDGSGNGSQFGKLPSKSDPSKKLESGLWYHVACTYDQDARTARIYVNGQLTDEAKDVGVTGSSQDNRITLAMQALGMTEAYRFCIGWSYNDFRPLQGRIAEARLWRVARSQQQIWDCMYRIPDFCAEDYPDLIGYWKFDEGQGNTIHDYSLYGNHGQANSDIIWPDGIEIPEINKED